MAIPESNNLFRDSGPRETLNYFFSRLQSGDLSPEEALAMLGAVHAELGKGGSGDPKVYQSYSAAMESLQQSRPDIYDYVVTAWGSRNASDSTSDENQEPGTDWSDAGEQKSERIGAQSGNGYKEIKMPGAELNESDEPEEPEEVEEKEDSSTDDTDEQGEQARQQEKEEEADGESDGDEVEPKEAQPEETQGSNEETQDESVEETEVDETRGKEQESPETEPLVEENALEGGEESTAEEAAGESEAVSESAESGGDEAAEPEETEWPKIEPSDIEEPLEGFEGEESPELPED